jgi:uncharacterized membrane protein
MDQTHVHLLITHLPVFGSFLGVVVLLQGLLTKSDQVKLAAYNIFIISAIGAGIAYLTGEAAEETIESIPGMVEASIETHEESAVYALTGLILLGVISLGAIMTTLRKWASASSVAIAVLSISIICFGLIARTGYLGGQIRHTEINSTTTTLQGQQEKGDEH